MLITPKKIPSEDFDLHIITLLTGDRETAIFYRTLASACSSFGAYLENVIRAKITFNIIDISEVTTCTKFSILKKNTKIKTEKGNKKPDLITVDPFTKEIVVYEIKVNLESMDSKKALTEKETYTRIIPEMESMYDGYKIKVFAVDYFSRVEDESKRRYTQSNFLPLLSGKEFCDKLNISYDEILSDVVQDAQQNCNLVKEYKEKPIKSILTINKPKNLECFL